MTIPTQQTEKALKLQKRLEKDLLPQKGVIGTSVSTVPGNHNQVCLKVMVDSEDITAKSLGIQDNYDDIPVILSHEEISPM